MHANQLTHSYAPRKPAITALTDGRFVVAWSDAGNGTDVDIRARVFDADGSEALGSGTGGDADHAVPAQIFIPNRAPAASIADQTVPAIDAVQVQAR